MLPSIKAVRDTILKVCEPHNIDLQTVTDAFQRLTVVDVVEFVKYDTPKENPIWGRFTRWHQSPAPYAERQTVVQVQYPTHLNESWRRFVVCKELCHSLEAPDGSHSVTEPLIDDLVDAFAIYSAQREQANISASYMAERLAEVGAIEILFPLCVRIPLCEGGQPLDHAALAATYKIPQSYVDSALRPDYMELISDLLA